MAVPAVVSLVTLGVADLKRATRFYEELGWLLSEESSAEISFFRTAGPLVALFPHDALAEDAGLPEAAPAAGYRGNSFSINVAGPEAVDAVLAEAAQAGAVIVRAPAETEWGGYSGYFTDPDGHLWECAHNPFWPIGENGLPVLPS